jgi:hypothetical protein
MNGEVKVANPYLLVDLVLKFNMYIMIVICNPLNMIILVTIVVVAVPEGLPLAVTLT